MPRSRIVDLYIHYPIRRHGVVLNYIIKYRNNFTLLLFLDIFGVQTHSSPNVRRTFKSRRMRWEGGSSMYERYNNAYKVLVEKLGGERPLGRSTCKWEDNKMDLKRMGKEVVEWIHLANDKIQWRILVKAVKKLWVP
jgi:hypothetical protein